MPVVLCDTSPIQYLHQVGQLHLLPALYGQVTIPTAVAKELATGITKGVDLPPLSGCADWLSVRSVRQVLDLEGGAALGGGELELLSLGVQIPESLILIDDALGRLHGQRLGLRCTGTVGVLLEAKYTVSEVRSRIQATASSGDSI